MISWGAVLGTAVWLAGLGLLLAGVSIGLYNRTMTTDAGDGRLAQLPTTPLLYVGGVVFLVGMILTAGSWPERGLWALLCCPLLLQASNLRQPASPRRTFAPAARSTVIRANARNLLGAGAAWLAKTELLWLAVLAPFLIFAGAKSAPLLLLLPVLWGARRLARGRFVPNTPLNTAILGLLLMVPVSLLVTADSADSFGKVAGLLLGIAAYFALIEYATDRQRLWRLLLVYALGGTGVAVVGLFSARWIDKFQVLAQVTARIPAMFRVMPGAADGIQPNEIAGALLWILPLQCALLIEVWARKGSGQPVGRFTKPLLAVLCAASAGTLLLTQSRSALLGAVVAALVALWLLLPRLRLVAVAAIILAAGTLFYLAPGRVPDLLLDSLGPGANLNKSISSAQGRVQIWSSGIAAVSDYPFTGVGMNRFRALVPTSYPILALPEGTDIGHAHNEFLQAALDLGLPGMVAYLAIWVVSAVLAVQTWRRSADRMTRAVALGIGACLIAHFSFAMTDAVALGAKPGIFFWALIALNVINYRHSLPPIETPMEAAL